jgi:hypothetical protein
MKKEYRLGQDIQKQDGTIRYTVDEKVDEIFGTPVYKTVFRGTKEECQAKLKELTK